MSTLDTLRLTLYDCTLLSNDLYPWFLPLTFFLLGACIGSFLNVIIYRMPRGLSICSPSRSFCPHCGTPIPGRLNLPIISWLWLRGRSACCHQPISPRYCIVELLTALLFLAVSLSQDTDVLSQLAISLWMATLLAILFIDWETMIVLRRLCLTALIIAVGAAILDPGITSGHIGLEALGLGGITGALVAAAFGFILLRSFALLGLLLFGLRSHRFTRRVNWVLEQAPDGEDIQLTIGGKILLLSQLFHESSDRLTLRQATLTPVTATSQGTPDTASTDTPDTASTGTSSPPADIILTPEALQLAGGRRILLEDHDRLTGSCTGYFSKRSAMGSGDAWIALAIGSLAGVDGVVMALAGGSFIGLVAAICARRGFGTPIPFGPSLITAALIWWFFGPTILACA